MILLLLIRSLGIITIRLVTILFWLVKWLLHLVRRMKVKRSQLVDEQLTQPKNVHHIRSRQMNDFSAVNAAFNEGLLGLAAKAQQDLLSEHSLNPFDVIEGKFIEIKDKDG